MNRSFIVAVLTVTMIIMMSSGGYAGIAVPHYFACDNCHGKFIANGGLNPTNACVVCHSSTAEASRTPINPGDMANYWGTVGGQPTTGTRSSHTWNVILPYNQASNVLEPTGGPSGPMYLGWGNSPDLNTPSGAVTCFRCHNPKLLSPANITPGVDKPFLRISNIDDALCRNCHRMRDNTTSSTATGSHQIFYRAYSTVYKLNTTAFRKRPLSPNANNPTANLGNYLSKGKIVCSTCHASHYADSSSATLGNRSTANGSAVDDPAKGLKGALQNSKGQLLRTDPIGLTPNAINVCSACHKETKNLNHNAKGQNVQCDHCHGAHVDFTGDGSSPNLYLVRRSFTNISIPAGKLAAGKKAIYNTATSLRFMRNDGNGICQVCHDPKQIATVAMHFQLDTRKADCLACHKHSDGFAASACDSCHGQPPVQGKAAAGYTLDEAFTPHATHADAAYYKYACKNCHYDGTRVDSHNTLAKTYQSVFIDTAGSVGDQAGLTKNIESDYNKTEMTCANVYCHSNGNPRVPAPGTGNAISWKSGSTPKWLNGKNKIHGQASECITCHDSTVQSGSPLTTNAHLGHVFTAKIQCYVCHDATVTAADIPSIKDRTKHANGTKDVIFVNQPLNFKGGAFSASFEPSNATCINSCHTNGVGDHPVTAAKWTDQSTGLCGTCHAAVPTTTLHPLHFSGTGIGPKLGPSPLCASCHDYSTGASTHANGVIDLKAGNSCDPCHPGSAGTPVWAETAIVTCESCHTRTASVVRSQFATYTASLKGYSTSANGLRSIHSQYSTAILKHVKCTTCHDASANHIGAGAAEKRLLTTGNGLCNNCHINAKMEGMSTARANMLTHGVSFGAVGTRNVFAKYSTIDDGRARDCAGCHDTHGTSNLYSIRTTINGRPISFISLTSFIVTTKSNSFYNGLCQVCHTKTNYYRNYTTPASHHDNENCLSCHTHKGGMFAFQQTIGGGCGDCHGYPPVSDIALYRTYNNYTNAKPQDYIGGGGAHTRPGHISEKARAKDGMINCSDCHYNTFVNGTHQKGPNPPVDNSFVNVVVDPKWKFNNASTITYKENTCSNVRCHFQPSPNWTTGQ